MSHFRTLPAADERNGGPIVNCVAASGVNIARAATNGAIPATDAEVIALRRATGDTTGGEGLPDLQKGLRARYGWTGYLDETWATIQTGLASGGQVYAVVGRYAALPARIRNAGQADVFHCVAVMTGAPGAPVMVDALQKPRPLYVPVTMGEVNSFCATGAFGSLGLAEYGHCGSVTVRSAAGIFTVYPDGHYRRNILPNIAPFTSRVGAVESHRDAQGQNPEALVQLLDTKRAGKWVNIHSSRVTYSAPKE